MIRSEVIRHVPENLLFDPRDPSFRLDPYPHYRALREADPVHRSPFGYWVLSRFAEVDALLRDARVSSAFPSDATWSRHRGGPSSCIVRSTSQWMMMLDGSAHRRVRAPLNQVFSVRAVERLIPRIEALVDELLDSLGEGEVDLISGLALPLPVTVICELLGIPQEDRGLCREWTDKIGHVVDPVVTADMCVAMNNATADFSVYLTELLGKRRANPGDDLLSLLLAHDLNEDEIVANILMLFNAGHETTVNVVGNGMLALLRHPDQLRLLRRRPELIEAGVDEIVRYDGPVQLAARIATEDMTFGDKTIPAGAKVMLLLGSANRDPDQYPLPDRLDLTRTGVRTLAFGSGPHYCVGALLGKVESTIVFSALLRRYGRIELACDEPAWRPHLTLRGLRALPCRVSATSETAAMSL